MSDDILMTSAEVELQRLRLHDAHQLAHHLGHRIHRIREHRRQQRELIADTRRLVAGLNERLAITQGEWEASCAGTLVELTALLFPPERNSPEAIERRRKRLEMRREARQAVPA